MSAATPQAQPEAPRGAVVSSAANVAALAGTDGLIELKLFGESALDKLSSLLMSFVFAALLGVGMVSFWMMTEHGFKKPKPAPVELIEVSGNGGGSPDGVMGGKQDINVAGGESSNAASNNMEDASDFEEPNVEETASGVIDTFIEANPNELASLDIAEAIPGAQPGQVATGRRASKIGNGMRGFGSGGPGDGGYSRENRWTIAFPAGQTPDEYARQLDFFGVELAVKFSGNSMEYASNFAGGNPQRHVGQGKADMRLYFLWQGAGRKSSDVELLRRAGIEVGNRDIFQFFPVAVEEQLVQAEVAFKGRQPAQIRRTVFTVVPKGTGYGFSVVSQDPIQ